MRKNESKARENESKARENESNRVTIGFGFTSDWMKKWREFFLSQSCSVIDAKPITFRYSSENRSRLILRKSLIIVCKEQVLDTGLEKYSF